MQHHAAIDRCHRGHRALPGALALVLALAAAAPARADTLNTWDFAGFEAQEIADYMDQRAVNLAINRALGQAILTLEVARDANASDEGERQTRRVDVLLSVLDPHDRQIVPIVPVRASKAEADRDLAEFAYMRDYGSMPVLFYRDDHGVIWPTAINPQTAPRIMAVYQQAMDAARADDRATRDAFLEVGMWYIGARLPVTAKATKATPSKGAVPEARPVTGKSASKPASSASSTASASATVESSGVWSMPPVKRGQAIERALGANLGKNFPVIDRFEKGVATSIKSLDVNAKSYQDARQVMSTVKGYIDKVAKFKGARWGDDYVDGFQITGRALDLAIPNVGTPAQQATFGKLVAYGKSKGVTLNVMVFR